MKESIEVTGRLFYDPTQLASLIETIAAPYLRPVVDTKIQIINNGKVISLKKEKIVTELPVRGIAIIEAFISRKLLSKSKWAKLPVPTLQDIWCKFITEEYMFTSEVYDLINNLLTDLNTEIVQFIGDDEWVMFFLNKKNRDFIIERTIDYRIHYYNTNVKEV